MAMAYRAVDLSGQAWCRYPGAVPAVVWRIVKVLGTGCLPNEETQLKILKRLRPHRSFQVVAVAILGVMGMAGATLGFAGTASATLTATPVSYLGTPNEIGLVPPDGPFNLGGGVADQPAAPWLFQLSSTGTNVTDVTEPAWSIGDQIDIPIFPHGGTVNNVTTGNWVAFDGTPSVAAAGGAAGSTAPTFSVSTETNPNDSPADHTAGIQDVLVITLTNSPAVTSPTGWNVSVLGVNYTTGATVTPGTISTDASGTDEATFNQGTGTFSSTTALQGNTGAWQNALTVTANAQVVPFGLATVTANNPPVSVSPNAVAAPISNVVIQESAIGEIAPAGDELCLVASNGTFGVTATEPTLTVTPSDVGGTATVNGTVATSGLAANQIFGTIVGISTTVPTTFTFSGLTVYPGNLAPGTVVHVTAYIATPAEALTGDCEAGTAITPPGNPAFSPVALYTVGVATIGTRISGSVADQTAEAALEAQYPATPGGGCVPNNANPDPGTDNIGSSVVLATDQNWPDALAASYLASYYHTGVLLTPTGSLSSYAAQAIQDEGISTVFIVGGPLAVATSVQTTLSTMPQYQCGGSIPRVNALGTPIDLNVQRIYGQTADGTAEAIATAVDSSNVGIVDISGAAATSAFGSTLYNDTTGTDTSSTLPTVPVRTAILATDQSFQDAASASSVSYFNHFPILITTPGSLSPQAETGLLDLGIQQVIELGGPIAISNSVNTQLTTDGIAVLRIAGQDYTDTSQLLAQFELNGQTSSSLGYPGPEGLNWSVNSVFNPGHVSPTPPTDSEDTFYAALARGDFYADALTSSVYTGNIFHGGTGSTFRTGPEPVLLTENPSTLGTFLTSFLNTSGSPFGVDPFYLTPITNPETAGKHIVSLTVFGGILALPDSTVAAALTAISAGANP